MRVNVVVLPVGAAGYVSVIADPVRRPWISELALSLEPPRVVKPVTSVVGGLCAVAGELEVALV